MGYNIPLHDANAAMTESMTEEDSEDERSASSGAASIIDTEGFLSPSGVKDDPLRRCVELSVRDNEQIEVQQGDVVGYYVDHFKNGDDKDDGGIQWMKNSDDVIIYYRDELPKEDIRPVYGVGEPDANDCGFGDSDSYTLAASTNAAPIISFTIGKSSSILHTAR